jgi:hypothetical protein
VSEDWSVGVLNSVFLFSGGALSDALANSNSATPGLLQLLNSFPNQLLMPTSSISKMSVEFGPMTRPAPCSP